MRVIVFLLLIVFTFGCNAPKKQTEVSAESWAVKMADAVMSRVDSLIYYDHSTRVRWQYDQAMLGLAIDRLGAIDSSYSKYMRDFVDYFVNEDGTIKHYRQDEYNIDRINPGKNLIVLYKRTGQEKYRTAIELLVEQMKTHPTTTE